MMDDLENVGPRVLLDALRDADCVRYSLAAPLLRWPDDRTELGGGQSKSGPLPKASWPLCAPSVQNF